MSKLFALSKAITCTCAMVAILGTVTISIAHGNPVVVNNGFEAPVFADNTHNSIDPASAVWMPTGLAGIDRGVPYGLAENCFPCEGSQMAFLQGDSGVTSLSQEISGFVPGESYSIKFDAKAIVGYNGANPFSVSLGGTELTFAGVSLLEPLASYRHFTSDPIVVTEESPILKFYDQGGVNSGKVSWIDSVQVVAALENLVDSGSFESPVFSDDTINYQPVGTDWNYEGSAGMGRGNVFGSNAPNSEPADGLQMAFLQGNSGNNKITPAPDGVSKLQQDVSGFEIGQSYTLTFETMGLDGFDGCNPFHVSINGTDLFGLVTPGIEYEKYTSEPFVATSETMSLLFYDQGDVTLTHFTWIDDVMVNPVSVPEPGSLSILFGSIMAMLVFSMRRQNK